MGRNKGTFDFSANLEGIIEGPIDAKQVVDTQADLINPVTWDDGTGTYWIYNGMMVAVGNDPALVLNGIYILLDKDNFTDLENWLNVGSPIQNQELVNRTIYCDPTGSDTTGDGTIGNPFRQPFRALEDIGTVIAVEITIQLNAGTYEWNQDTATACQARTVINGLIEFRGVWNTEVAGVTWATTTPNRMLYDCVIPGTATADQYVGFFKFDANTRPDPISYNSAGTTNIQIEAARPSRTGTRDIVSHASIIEVTGAFVLDLTYYNDVSSEINFVNVRLNQVDGENMQFEYHKTSMWFQSCYLDVPAGIIIGQFSMAWNQEFVRFDRCYLVHDGTDQRLMNIRRTAGFLNFNRTVFDGSNSIPTTIGVLFIDGKNISVTLLTCIIRGPGAGYSAIDGSNYHLNINDDFVVRDFEHVFRQYKGTKWVTPFTTTNPKAWTNLENVSYLANIYEQEFSVNIDIVKWVGKVSMFADHRDALIAPQDKVNIQILPDDEHFPEISLSLSEIALPVNTTSWITVGDYAINHAIEIQYSLKRGALIGEVGKVAIYVVNYVAYIYAVYSDAQGTPGVTFGVQLSGTEIQLGVIVDNSLTDTVDILFNALRTINDPDESPAYPYPALVVSALNAFANQVQIDTAQDSAGDSAAIVDFEILINGTPASLTTLTDNLDSRIIINFTETIITTDTITINYAPNPARWIFAPTGTPAFVLFAMNNLAVVNNT